MWLQVHTGVPESTLALIAEKVSEIPPDSEFTVHGGGYSMQALYGWGHGMGGFQHRLWTLGVVWGKFSAQRVTVQVSTLT